MVELSGLQSSTYIRSCNAVARSLAKLYFGCIIFQQKSCIFLTVDLIKGLVSQAPFMIHLVRHMRLIVNMHTIRLKNFCRRVNTFIWSKYFACGKDRYKSSGTKSFRLQNSPRVKIRSNRRVKLQPYFSTFHEFEIRLCFGPSRNKRGGGRTSAH